MSRDEGWLSVGATVDTAECPVELIISVTTAKTGPTIRAARGTDWQRTGIKIADPGFSSLPLHRHDFYGDWNCTPRDFSP
jgi:hypothetical protein